MGVILNSFIALGSGKLTERAGRRLKLESGLLMQALGVVLAFRPEWLAG